MTGGLTQLVAVGAQDVFLSGDAKKSVWTSNFRRSKMFALESIEQTLNGEVNFDKSCSFILKRAGDLVCGMMFQVILRRGPSSVTDPVPYYPAEHLFEGVELLIGGQRIDFIPHNWLRLYAQMYYNNTQKTTYDEMNNFGPETEGQERTFYVPIPFFFNNAWNTRLALPLIALQYHEVEFRLKLTKASDIIGIDQTFAPQLRVYADYVFLDSPERIWFAQNPHEYVVNQLQFTRSAVLVDEKIRHYKEYLNFNHPCMALTWCLTPGDSFHGKFTCLPGETYDNTAAPINKATLLLNGIERFTERPGTYFQLANPWLSQYGMGLTSGVYTYNFGLNNYLALTQRGTLNFSRIDSAILKYSTKAAVIATPPAPRTQATTDETQTYTDSAMLSTLEVYTTNYNVLRVMSGMGGLAYSN